MSLHTFCPFCGKYHRPADELLGQQLVCTSCGREFVVRREEVPDPFDPSQLAQRLDALEQRIGKIEAALRMSPAPRPRPRPVITDLPPYEPRPRTEEIERPVERVEEPAATTAAAKDIPYALPVEEAVPPEPPSPPPLEAPAQAEPPPRRGNVEEMIGLKWAAWVGAVVLVIGIGLGIKYAYDQGWLNRLSAQTRLGLMSLVGFALIGCGEWVYRKVNIISAAGLFGAGVGTLFLVSFAGHVYFEVYTYQTAFLFVALTTLIGSAVAMRARLVSVAVLAQIGGAIAPFILSKGEPPGVAFFSYLFMLQLVALVLALWGNSPKWWILRTLSLATTAMWVVLAFVARVPHGLSDEALWFSLLYAIVYQVELLWSAWRAKPAEGQARELDNALWGWGTVFSLLVSAGCTATVLHILDGYRDEFRGAWVLGFAGVCAAVGFLLNSGTNLRLRSLAAGFRIQAMALLILAVPVALSSVWITLAWAMLALAFAVIGAQFDRWPARIAGPVTWMLAIGHLVFDITTEQAGQGVLEVWVTLLGEPIKAYTILAWLLACAGMGVAWLTQADLRQRDRILAPEWSQTALVMSVLASVVWLTACISLPPLGATFAIVCWAWLLVGANFLTERLDLALHALAVLGLAAVKWAVVDTLAERLSPTWSALEYYPVFNPVLGLGLLLAASLGCIFWLRRGRLEQSLRQAKIDSFSTATLILSMIALVVAITTIGLSFEVDRLIERGVAQGVDLTWPASQLKLLGLTMLWTLAVVALAVAWRRLEYPTVIPWVLLALLVVKFLLVDTLVWRLDAKLVMAPVLFNVQVATALVLLGGIALLAYLSPLSRGWPGLSLRSPGPLPDGGSVGLTGIVVLGVVLVITWSGMLEIDRGVAHLSQRGYELVWPRWELVQMGWTIWWVAVVLGFLACVRRWGRSQAFREAGFAIGWIALAVIACKFLFIDALMGRLPRSQPVAVMAVINFQVLTGVVVLGGLLALRFLAPLANGQNGSKAGLLDALSGQQPLTVEMLRGNKANLLNLSANLLAVLVGLALGTLEIDRLFSVQLAAALTDPVLAKQVAISIFWSVFALSAVAFGFPFRTAWLRYFGLALFAITLLKVAVVDLRQVEQGYRILSTVGLGLLLLGTSVLYGTLSPRLLRDRRPTPETSA